MNKIYPTSLLSLLAATLLPINAYADWGTPEEPHALMTVDNNEVAAMKTARTADGKTFVSWLTYGDRSNWGYELRLQLLDTDGNPMWEPDGIQVEDVRNCSWTADYWMVVSPEGDAIISWADARDQEELDTPTSHVSVVYKVSQNQEMLWGDRGIELGEQYKYPATLYQFGDDTYCLMQSAEDWGTPQITRLSSEGTFEFEPKDFFGQLIQSEGSDFISVYSNSDGTVAMRYTQDIEPVWDKPALLSTYTYTGYGRDPYCMVSDGNGGVVVAFSRAMGGFSHLPVVAYVTADGEAVFGESADVIATETNDHNYAKIGVNTETETILATWQMSSGIYALGGQLMDYYGERLWGDDGKLLATKDSPSGYSYGPIAVYPAGEDKWFVVYADELWWAHSQLNYSTYDSEGNLLSNRQGIDATGVDDYFTYMDGSDFYMFFVNEYTDDDWEDHAAIMTVKIDGISTGIENINTDNNSIGQTEYYNLSGMRISKPLPGLNIVRHKDGTTQKVLMK
ncbi:MAG: hypothetical protein K2H47_09795 [Muribaculaceae bacterium]|nr:hypothetical protein [Muribaculaceae bacterium]